MKIYEAYGYGKYRAGVGTIRASGGDCGPGSEMLCVGRTWQRNGGVVPTLTGDHENRVTDYTALAVGNGQLHQISLAEQSNTLDCMHDKQAILINGKPPRKYIVRRLTPLECCRLQGFPDWWISGCEANPITGWWLENGEWMRVINPYGAVEGSDSAKYKLWGNGMALPNMLHVMRGIVRMEE